MATLEEIFSKPRHPELCYSLKQPALPPVIGPTPSTLYTQPEGTKPVEIPKEVIILVSPPPPLPEDDFEISPPKPVPVKAIPPEKPEFVVPGPSSLPPKPVAPPLPELPISPAPVDTMQQPALRKWIPTESQSISKQVARGLGMGLGIGTGLATLIKVSKHSEDPFAPKPTLEELSDNDVLYLAHTIVYGSMPTLQGRPLYINSSERDSAEYLGTAKIQPKKIALITTKRKVDVFITPYRIIYTHVHSAYHGSIGHTIDNIRYLYNRAASNIVAKGIWFRPHTEGRIFDNGNANQIAINQTVTDRSAYWSTNYVLNGKFQKTLFEMDITFPPSSWQEKIIQKSQNSLPITLPELAHFYASHNVPLNIAHYSHVLK